MVKNIQSLFFVVITTEYKINTIPGNQTQCPASGLVPTHGATKLLKKATSTLEHTGQDAGHYFFIPRDASKAKDTPVSTDANSNVAKAVNTTNNSASSNLPLQDRSALKNSEKIVQTPAFSPGYYTNNPKSSQACKLNY